MLESALIKTHEVNVKTKITTQKDCDEVLIEEYNNGYINVDRL